MSNEMLQHHILILCLTSLFHLITGMLFICYKILSGIMYIDLEMHVLPTAMIIILALNLMPAYICMIVHNYNSTTQKTVSAHHCR